MEKYIVSYQMYGYMLDDLVSKISLSRLSDLRYVYSPSRGGLPVAVHLSHYLDLKYIQNIGNDIQPSEVLVADDIADTGKTIAVLNEFYKTKFKFAALFVKDRSVVVPDFYVEKNNQWIVFPWEIIDEEPNREGYI